MESRLSDFGIISRDGSWERTPPYPPKLCGMCRPDDDYYLGHYGDEGESDEGASACSELDRYEAYVKDAGTPCPCPGRLVVVRDSDLYGP